MVDNYQKPGWYYEYRGERKGPVSESGILQLYKAKIIKIDSLVWTQGLPEWMPLSKAGLFNDATMKTIVSDRVGNNGIIKKTVAILLIVIILISGGVLGYNYLYGVRRIAGAWQGKNIIGIRTTFIFEPDKGNQGCLYAKSDVDAETGYYYYNIMKMSSKSFEITYFTFTIHSDGRIIHTSDDQKFIVTFDNNSTIEIDGWGALTSISRIDSAAAKSILNVK